jgi:Dolichyl-phosphate-mannose-protein mannosyltransferase
MKALPGIEPVTGRILSAVALGLALGTALVFVVARLLFLFDQHYFVFFRDIRYHLTAASYFYDVIGFPYKIYDLYAGPSGIYFLHYPIVRYLIDLPFIAAFGKTVAAFSLAGTLWWCLLVGFLVALGRRVSGSWIGGALAAGLVAFNPYIACLADAPNVDLPVTVLVVVTAWAVFRSDLLAKTAGSVIAGSLVGLAVLVKPTSLFFTGPLFLGAFLWGEGDWRTRAKHLAYAAAVGLVCGLQFYIFFLPAFIKSFFGQTAAAGPGFGENLVFYLTALPKIASTTELLLYLACSVFLMIVKDRVVRVLLLWFALSYAVHPFTAYRFAEYLLPAYVGLAMVAPRMIAVFDKRKVAGFASRAAALAIVAFTCLNFWMVIFSESPRKAPVKFPETSRLFRIHGTGAPFFSDLGELYDQGAYFVAETSGLRTGLNRYPGIPLDRMLLLGQNPWELGLLEDQVTTYMGLDRSYTATQTLLIDGLRQAVIDRDPEDFARRLASFDLIVWTGSVEPLPGNLEDLLNAIQASRPPDRGMKERVATNLDLLERCTKTELTLPYFRGVDVTFLRRDPSCL